MILINPFFIFSALNNRDLFNENQKTIMWFSNNLFYNLQKTHEKNAHTNKHVLDDDLILIRLKTIKERYDMDIPLLAKSQIYDMIAVILLNF